MKSKTGMLLGLLLASCQVSKKDVCSPIFSPNFNVTLEKVVALGRIQGIDSDVYTCKCGDTTIRYQVENSTDLYYQTWEFSYPLKDSSELVEHLYQIGVREANRSVIMFTSFKERGSDLVFNENSRHYFGLSFDFNTKDSITVGVSFTFPKSID